MMRTQSKAEFANNKYFSPLSRQEQRASKEHEPISGSFKGPLKSSTRARHEEASQIEKMKSALKMGREGQKSLCQSNHFGSAQVLQTVQAQEDNSNILSPKDQGSQKNQNQQKQYATQFQAYNSVEKKAQPERSEHSYSCQQESAIRQDSKRGRIMSPDFQNVGKVFKFFQSEILLKNCEFEKGIWKREKITSRDTLKAEDCLPTVQLKGALISKLASKFSKSELERASIKAEITTSRDNCLSLAQVASNSKNPKPFLTLNLTSNPRIEEDSKNYQLSLKEFTRFSVLSYERFASEIGEQENQSLSQTQKKSFELQDFFEIQTTIQVNKTSLDSKVEFNLLVPNISFDFYKIKSLAMVSSSQLNLAKNNFQSGPLLCDQNQKVNSFLPVYSDSIKVQQKPVVGIWISGLPKDQIKDEGDQQKVESFMKNPLVWQTCTNFLFKSKSFPELSSASTGKSTFLVCYLDEFKRPLFYEFKI